MTMTPELATMDASTINLIANLIGLMVSSLTAVLLAWIALKQAALRQTVGVLEKNTNSMKDALVAATKEAGLAQGKVEGRREFERENKPAPADFSASNPGHIAVVEPEPEPRPKKF